jgi:hypothetical protein
VVGGRSRVDAGPGRAGRRVALAGHRQGDPQTDAGRLRRAPALVAGGALRLAGCWSSRRTPTTT